MVAWIEQWHHDITPITRLPLPPALEYPDCMVGRRLSRLHRRLRQLAPRPQLRTCCDYHGQDWALASETAIRLLGIARAEGHAGEDAADRVHDLVVSELSPSDARAVYCLVSTIDPLMLNEEDGEIHNGRHRIQAMIDQGVRRTVVLRLVLLDPVTGRRADQAR